MLRELIERIVIRPTARKGEVTVELRGKLVGLLGLAGAADEAPTLTLVVAGARNHRELTLPPVSI